MILITTWFVILVMMNFRFQETRAEFGDENFMMFGSAARDGF